MRRRLLNLLTALSLLLLVATVAVWVRSQWAADYLGWHSWRLDAQRHENKEFRVAGIGAYAGIGIVGHVRTLEYGSLAQPTGGWSGFLVNGRYGQWWAFSVMLHAAANSSGFSLHWFDDPPTAGYVGQQGWAVTLPLWSLAAAFAIVPAARLSRHLRRKQPAGLWPSCGYDLRATPGRCPECGTPAKAPV